MLKVIAFDFDGVIINSHNIQKHALLESYKIVCKDGEPSVGEFFRLSGDSLKNIFTKMNLPLDMIEHYTRISKEKISLIKVYDGMKELLQWLKKENFKCAICTGKDKKRTVEILEYIGFYDFFDFIICSDEVKNPKPDPESLFTIKNYFNVNTNEMIMIGDSKNDITCSNSAGVESIAVTWGDGLIDDIRRENPTYVVNNVSELKAVFQLIRAAA